MPNDFRNLQRATLKFEYLKSNSTTHENPFSAIAELADNAYDAEAKLMTIDFVDTVENKEYLEIFDDGLGMSKEEALNAFAFGHSKKKDEHSRRHMIGCYGNGLKSGAFHLGRELFIVTKQNEIFTVILISHDFQEREKISDAIVFPCPSFNEKGDPIYNGHQEEDRFDQEMEIIDKYAPIGQRTLQDLFEKFSNKKSGTLIIIGGLTRSVMGELSFKVTEDDIRMEGENLDPMHESLRFYLSRLYCEQKTKISLLGKLVHPMKLDNYWVFRFYRTFSADQFKSARAINTKEADDEIQRLTEEERLLKSKLGGMNNGEMSMDREARIAQNKMRNELEKKTKQLKQAQEQKKLAAKSTKNIIFFTHIGTNVVNRDDYGISFFINRRLIIGNYRQMKFYDDPATIGISMSVEMSYDVLYPTHNKQGFENKKDFTMLVKRCEAILKDYFQFIRMKEIPDLISKEWRLPGVFEDEDEAMKTFWNKLGYENWRRKGQKQVLNEETWKLIDQNCGVWRICQECRMWRRGTSRSEMKIPAVDDEAFCCRHLPPFRKCDISSSDSSKMKKLPEDMKAEFDKVREKRRTEARMSSTPVTISRRSESIAGMNVKTEPPESEPEPESEPIRETSRIDQRAARRLAEPIVTTNRNLDYPDSQDDSTSQTSSQNDDYQPETASDDNSEDPTSSRRIQRGSSSSSSSTALETPTPSRSVQKGSSGSSSSSTVLEATTSSSKNVQRANSGYSSSTNLTPSSSRSAQRRDSGSSPPRLSTTCRGMAAQVPRKRTAPTFTDPRLEAALVGNGRRQNQTRIKREPVTSSASTSSRVVAEEDDDEEEEEAEPIVKKAKQKTTAKKNDTSKSEKWAYEMLNKFMECLDQPKLARNETRHMDPEKLIQHYFLKKNLRKDKLQHRKETKLYSDITTVLNYFKGKGDLNIPTGPTADAAKKIENLVSQINAKNSN